MSVEQNQAFEKCEYSNQECNDKLEQLENRIAVDFPFEKTENGSYNLKIDNITLDLDVSAETLVEANKYILERLTYYQQNDSKFYEEYFYLSGWWNKDIDLSIDWFLSTDPTYVTSERFEEIFWSNTNEDKQKLIDFLHKILNVRQPEWFKKIDFNDKVDINSNQKLLQEIKKSISEKNIDFNSVQEVLNSNKAPNRSYSIKNLFQLLQAPIEPWKIQPRSFMNLTYNGIPYIVENSSLRNDRKINFELSQDSAYVNVTQNWNKLWYFILKDYNDQIILSQLTGRKDFSDYTIPKESSSKYEWSRSVK